MTDRHRTRRRHRGPTLAARLRTALAVTLAAITLGALGGDIVHRIRHPHD